MIAKLARKLAVSILDYSVTWLHEADYYDVRYSINGVDQPVLIFDSFFEALKCFNHKNLECDAVYLVAYNKLHGDGIILQKFYDIGVIS